MLSELISDKHVNQFPLHEFFYLVREPADPARYNMYERKLIDALKIGPCILGKLAATAGVDLYHLDSERLEAEGVVMRCGLTPTDFMHIKGDYNEYDREASILAARFLLLSLKREDTPEELLSLADEVYDMVEGCMYENLLRILLSRQYPDRFSEGLEPQTAFLIRDAWANRHTDGGALFNQMLGTKAAMVGVGAPTHVFLPPVARALGTECVLPEHAEVANAIGALMADIHTVVRVDISQRLSSTGGIYYIVHTPSGSSEFDSLDEATDLARAAAEDAAVKEARARGALGGLAVDTYVERHTVESKWGTDVALGCTAVSEVTARFG